MSDQPCKLPLERNGFQIHVLVFVNIQMHASLCYSIHDMEGVTPR